MRPFAWVGLAGFLAPLALMAGSMNGPKDPVPAPGSDLSGAPRMAPSPTPERHGGLALRPAASAPGPTGGPWGPPTHPASMTSRRIGSNRAWTSTGRPATCADISLASGSPAPGRRPRGSWSLSVHAAGASSTCSPRPSGGNSNARTGSWKGSARLIRASGPLEPWIWVFQNCQYQEDHVQFRAREVWQPAKDTYRCRRVDCEDTAIPAADWPGSANRVAQVAVGNVRKGGHAWVALRLKGRSDILEKTGGEGNFRRMPPGAEFMPDCFPRAQMERPRIRFRTSGTWARDYWDEREWAEAPWR